MTDTQLWIAVGVPVLFNGLAFTLVILYVNAKFDALQQMLLRVEGVLDARLKHLEEAK
jgi:ABC-type uncharacterized transport system permease subunit